MENEINRLKDAIQQHEKRISELESLLKNRTETIEETTTNGEIVKLSKRTSIPTQKILEIFDREDNTLTVLKFVGENEKERTQNISLVCLLGYKHLFGTEEMLSQEMRRNVAENGIPLNNFSTHINELSPQLIRRKGKLKSPKTTYRLTILGESRAREILKMIIES